jgi:hypothetical protein
MWLHIRGMLEKRNHDISRAPHSLIFSKEEALRRVHNREIY